MKISYPFLHADRIKTPTLFLGGDKDMNVPLHNGEQMYQALKSMGIDTELVDLSRTVSRPLDAELS
jgi:dipeptidyl aminopeptidase/acylaminoacyl peptidase